MGKKPNWFRRFFSGKNITTGESTKGKNQNQWSSSPYTSSTMDASTHAIVVAAATAAVAEAAVAAAKAAVEVVRLTSGRGGCTPMAYVSRYWEAVAAVKIQSLFRGYLARRALRALKALVKLQALVRGHIVRKKTADTLRRMQALVRVQSRARASRACMSKSSQTCNKSSVSHHLGSVNPIKYIHQPQTNSTKIDQSSKSKSNGPNPMTREIDLDRVHYGAKWLDHWMKENSLKDNKATDKILEIDTWKPHLSSIQRNTTLQKSQHVLPSNYYDTPFMPLHSLSSKPKNGDSTSISSLKHYNEKDEATSWTAETSPQVFSASSRPGTSTGRSVFSPTKSEYSKSVFSGYADHPNYMSNTESYRAKVRSQSTPRLRMELEKYGSTRRSSVHGFLNTRI